jgi:hypothetical protein
MSYETFPLTPHYVAVQTENFNIIETRFESGDVQTRARWPRPRRIWSLSWENASEEESEKLKAFLRDHHGPADYFEFDAYDKVPRPYAGPLLSPYESGSLSSHLCYVKYAWSDGTNFTTPSEYRSATVAANNVLTVTVPYFPASVTRAYVYISSDNATYHRQTTYISGSGGTWTEPDTGWVATGVSPATTNSLSESSVVHFVNQSVDITKAWIDAYDMSCQLEEVFPV